MEVNNYRIPKDCITNFDPPKEEEKPPVTFCMRLVNLPPVWRKENVLPEDSLSRSKLSVILNLPLKDLAATNTNYVVSFRSICLWSVRKPKRKT